MGMTNDRGLPPFRLTLRDVRPKCDLVRGRTWELRMGFSSLK
jgi:hypothetical protein